MKDVKQLLKVIDQIYGADEQQKEKILNQLECLLDEINLYGEDKLLIMGKSLKVLRENKSFIDTLEELNKTCESVHNIRTELSSKLEEKETRMEKHSKTLTLEELKDIARKTSTPEYFERMEKEEKERERKRDVERAKKGMMSEKRQKEIDKLCDDIEKEVDRELAARDLLEINTSLLTIKFK